MGISIETALEKEIISKETLSILPSKCKCGSPIEFSDSMRSIVCSNKKCHNILIGRINKFNKMLGLDIKEIDIEYLISNLHISTPYQLLMLDEVIDKNSQRLKGTGIQSDSELIQKIRKIKQNEYLLYEIIELCGIDNISKVSYKVFSGFDTIEEAFNEIESGQVSFLNERLGIKNQDSSILSLEIYSEIMDLREEFIFAESLFKLKKDERPKLNIAFNDNIIPFINVEELLDWMNYEYKFRFNHVSTISNNTDILVKGVESTSSKFRIARLINDKNIAELMNNGELSLDDIGKFTDTNLKPKGSIIFIDNLDNIISRLNKFK